MTTRAPMLVTVAFILACGVTEAGAQQPATPQMPAENQQQQFPQGGITGPGMMGRRGIMGEGMMGHGIMREGMMERGMMGHGNDGAPHDGPYDEPARYAHDFCADG
jgi:hypothetical protein